MLAIKCELLIEFEIRALHLSLRIVLDAAPQSAAAAAFRPNQKDLLPCWAAALERVVNRTDLLPCWAAALERVVNRRDRHCWPAAAVQTVTWIFTLV